MSEPSFALIGRAYPSEAFASLHRASETARAARRGMPHAGLTERRWRYAGTPIALPPRLQG